MNQYLIDSAFAFLKQRILVAEQSLQLKEFALNLNLPLDDAIRYERNDKLVVHVGQ